MRLMGGEAYSRVANQSTRPCAIGSWLKTSVFMHLCYHLVFLIQQKNPYYVAVLRERRSII